MKINVRFFEENFVAAVGAGVYGIYAKTDNREELLYVGESVFVLVRCATHLYEISKGKGYLGFDEDKIENEKITLVFKLYKNTTSKKERIALEHDLIQTKKPKMQSGIKDGGECEAHQEKLETDMRRRFPFQGKLASTIDGRTFTTRRYTKTL